MKRWLAAIGLALCLGSLPVFAATLTSMSDTMSEHQVSRGGNHTIRFRTPTGVDASSDTITLTFAPGFGLSTITSGDVSLTHGPVSGEETTETVAATAVAGVWGASVSGQVLTLTPPTNAALGEITALDYVIVKIGTHVLGGTHKITNPPIIGSFVLSLAGSFGDAGGMLLPIASADTVTIVASIPQNAGGGGGAPGPAPAPVPAPVVLTISHLQAQTVSSTSVNVSWETSAPADAELAYGQDVTYASGTVKDPTRVLVRTLSVNGLFPGVTYHAKATSKDQNGNTASSNDFTFQTTPAQEALTLSNIQVAQIRDVSTLITWSTNRNASGQVSYGETEAYGLSAGEVGVTSNHAVTLFNLKPLTVYHIQIISSTNGLSTASKDITFTTLDDATPPSNIRDFAAVPGDKKNTLIWRNPPDPDFSDVLIVSRTDRFPMTPYDGRSVYQGADQIASDTGLVNGTTYFYAAFAEDKKGNVSSGALAKGTPQAAPQNQPQPNQKPPKSGQNQPGTQENATGTPAQATSTIQETTTTQTVVNPLPAPVPEPAPAPLPAPLLAPVSPRPLHTQFFGQGNVPITPNALGQLFVPGTQPVSVRIPFIGSAVPIQGGNVQVGNSLYLLSPTRSGDALSATFTPNTPSGTDTITVTVNFSDGEKAVERYGMTSKTPGHVLEKTARGWMPVPGVTIEMYQQGNGALVLAIMTAADGSYEAFLPNGTYELRAKKTGYDDVRMTVAIDQGLLTRDLVMRRTSFIQGLLAKITNSVQTPQNQSIANKVVAPTLVTVAAANVATAASAFNLLNYLRFLITQPLLFIRRRKRHKWGLVYDSLSKKPLDLAIVRLIQMPKNVIVQTRITNLNGQFYFRVKPGEYRMESVKPGYRFPTEYLKGETRDIDLLDLYHGEEIPVSQETEIASNIPADSIAPEEEPKSIVFKRALRQIQGLLSFLSIPLMTAVLVVAPSFFNAGLLLAQVVIYVILHKLSLVAKPGNWGMVYDERTRKPLDRAVVRIFHKKFNKLLETQVTDSRGKYGFFASKGLFYITANREGYAAYQSPDVDLTSQQKGIVDKSIALKRI